MEKYAILQALKGKNPNLRPVEQDKDKICSNRYTQEYLQQLEKTAQELRGAIIPTIPYTVFRQFHETGSRRMFEDGETGYFHRRKRLCAFGVMSWLYGRKEDLDALSDIIWAICDEYTWSLAAHLKPESFTTVLEDEGYMVDLFAAETAQALAEICYFLQDALPPIIHKRVSYLVRHRVIDRVLQQDFRWTKAASNWAAVCAGSVGMAAIYQLEHEEDLLAAVLERLWPTLESFLTSFSEDGSCLEGLGYWSYGFGYYVSFADLLLRRTQGEIDLLCQEKVRKIALFQQKCYFEAGQTVSFSDSVSCLAYLPGLTCYLSNRYNDIEIPPKSSMQGFHSDHCYRWNQVFRNLYWAKQEPDTACRYGCHLLPDAQWYLCSAQNGVGIAAKGGNNGEPHNHNDVGSFQIFKRGEEMLCDLGSGEYTRQYFSEQRYDFMNCGSQGHSLPIIDGNTQRAGKQAAARDFEISKNGISLDLSDTYALDSLLCARRKIHFDDMSGNTFVEDVFLFEEGMHRVCERFVTQGMVEKTESGVCITKGGQQIELVAEQCSEVLVSKQEYMAHQGKPDTFFSIDFCVEGNKEIFFKLQILS